MRAGPFRMEYRRRTGDGAYRWVLDSGVPKFGSDGSFAGYIGSCLDISERKDAEGALFASQERYTLATAAAAVGVWDWSVGTNDIFVDNGIKRSLGSGTRTCRIASKLGRRESMRGRNGRHGYP